jgi:hypothetical protein
VPERILIIEDEQSVAEIIAINLKLHVRAKETST